MRNKSENKTPVTYIVHAVRYIRQETSVLVTAADDVEARDIARDEIFDDHCTWETDCDYYAQSQTISVEEYGK